MRRVNRFVLGSIAALFLMGSFGNPDPGHALIVDQSDAQAVTRYGLLTDRLVQTQSFTAGVTGQLTNIELPVWENPSYSSTTMVVIVSDYNNGVVGSTLGGTQ